MFGSSFLINMRICCWLIKQNLVIVNLYYRIFAYLNDNLFKPLIVTYYNDKI